MLPDKKEIPKLLKVKNISLLLQVFSLLNSREFRCLVGYGIFLISLVRKYFLSPASWTVFPWTTWLGAVCESCSEQLTFLTSTVLWTATTEILLFSHWLINLQIFSHCWVLIFPDLVRAVTDGYSALINIYMPILFLCVYFTIARLIQKLL